jgi:nitrate/nitrite transporter NarK
MILIVTGLVFIVIGFGNRAVGKLHPERPNASLTLGLGYVGIVIGVITLIGAIVMILAPTPNLPAPS